MPRINATATVTMCMVLKLPVRSRCASSTTLHTSISEAVAQYMPEELERQKENDERRPLE